MGNFFYRFFIQRVVHPWYINGSWSNVSLCLGDRTWRSIRYCCQTYNAVYRGRLVYGVEKGGWGEPDTSVAYSLDVSMCLEYNSLQMDKYSHQNLLLLVEISEMKILLSSADFFIEQNIWKWMCPNSLKMKIWGSL